MLITKADTTVPITVLARTDADPRTAFRIVAPIDLSTVFRRQGPFPGITRVDAGTADWDRPGLTRHPIFDDGSTVTESMTEYVDGVGFAYELTHFTNVLRRLAEGVRGEFSFLPDGTGTTIRWTYEFKPLPGRRWFLAGPFKPLWTRYMTAALARMAAATKVES